MVHLAVWKIKLPRRQTKILLYILFGGLTAALVFSILNPSFSLLGILVPHGPAELLSTALYVTAFTLAYMITYSAIEADSPTLVMIKTIADAGEAGIRKEDFFKALNDDVLLEPRLRDLRTDHMAVFNNGIYSLTGKGRLFAAIFIKWHILLDREPGG